MSQSGPLMSSSVVTSVVKTLTGNSGGAVGPDASGNINVTGNGTTGITTVGTPASNLINIIASQASTTQFGTIKTATNAQAAAQTDANNALTSSNITSFFSTNPLPVNQGGTNLTATPTNGQLLIGNGAGYTLATLIAGANITITNGAGSITIAADTGSETVNYTAVNHAASPYTAISTDYYFGVDVSGGVVSILLPNAPATGRIFAVKDKTGGAAVSNITVTTVGGVVNIDGATTFVMKTNFQSIQVIFNGVAYEVF